MEVGGDGWIEAVRVGWMVGEGRCRWLKVGEGGGDRIQSDMLISDLIHMVKPVSFVIHLICSLLILIWSSL